MTQSMILVESTAEMIIVESGPIGPAGPIGAGVSVSSGAGVPAFTPLAIGDIYVDTSNDNAYQATDTASSADWKQTTGAGGGDLLAGNNLSDVAVAATAFANIKQAASATATGVVELATIAEVDAGTDTVRAVTPAGLAGSALQTKLDEIEALADVTDALNVAAAGALMDSEVDGDIKTLVLPASTTISTYGATLVDDADDASARTTLGLGDVATTDAADYATAAQGTLADEAAVNYPVGRIETGTTYTLAATDHGKLIMFSNSSLVTVTLPTNADVAIPDWFSTMLQSTGAAGLTLDISAITPNGSSPKTTVAQNEGLGPVKTATDTWSIFGGTAA